VVALQNGTLPLGLHRSHQLAATGVMGPLAAHMQHRKPRLQHQIFQYSENGGRHRPHRHMQPLAQRGLERRIEAQEHGVMGLGLQIGREHIERTLAMVQVTAHQQTWTTPVPQPPQGLCAQQKWIGIVQQHPPGPTESQAQGSWRGHAGAGFVGAAPVRWPTPLPLLI
jgi:hypothetical protein